MIQKSIELFQQEIGNIISGNFSLLPQESFQGKRKTSIHYRKEINQVKNIDLNWSGEKISRYIRATYMPGFEPP